MSRRRSLVTGLCFVLALLISGLPAVAFALDDDPNPPDPPAEEPFEPAPGGFDWTVPDRFTVKSDGRYNWHYDEVSGSYATSYVRPTSWPVDLRGCRTEQDHVTPGVSGNTYLFLTAAGQRVSGYRCNVKLQFPHEGSYQVKMIVTARDGSTIGRWQQTVVVKDLLIVSIGDSYASGEGNPEYWRTEGQTYGDWVDDRCHRSSFAGPARAAYQFERSDPKTSVTFLSFACSGGTINLNTYGDTDTFDPYKPMDPNRMAGSGILGPYVGAQPPNPEDFNDKVPSQIDQLKAALGVDSITPSKLREIDALLMSAGGNDAGFGLLASACVIWDYCLVDTFTGTEGFKVPLPTRVGQDLAAMPARYDALADALTPNSLGLKIAKTYITEYPDPGTELRADTNRVEECEEILEDVMYLAGMEIEGRQWIRGSAGSPDRELGTELAFARNVFLPGLNGAIASAAQDYGWHYVGGIGEGFQGHGYCVGPNDSPDSQRYVQTAAMAAVYQGPAAREKTKGTLHPNRLGHQVYRDRIVDAARAQLASAPPDGNVTYAFDTTLPTASAVVDPAANAAGWHASAATVTVTGQAGGTNTLSRVEHQVDGGAWQLTDGVTASVSVTAEGVHNVAYRAVDTVENVSASQSVIVRVDLTDPGVTITAPTTRDYLLGEQVVVAYTCADTGSGMTQCDAAVPNGDRLDTNTGGSHTFAVTSADAAGNTTTVTVPYRVVFDFGGFLSPIDPAPTMNTVKAGQAVPVRFSLGGDQGMGILAVDSPRSRAVPCDWSAPLDAIEQTADSAGKSGLSYENGVYIYRWDTSRAWAGTCRRLDVELSDGVVHSVTFDFLR